MPPFKDEHILIIAPGSQTTLAQLGLPESFTPARLHIPSRMFPAEKKGEWEPYRVREKRKEKSTITNGLHSLDSHTNTDTTMTDVGGSNGIAANGNIKGIEDDEETLYEEDVNSDEGSVYPLREGRVVDWSCFFALLNYVYNTLSPPFHTPILVITQPTWTAQDHETLTQFFFEKFKTPAFCLMDSALAVCYAYGQQSATVIDVGFEKVDVTAVSDFIAHDVGRGVAIPGCGGEGMTQRLLDLLGPQGFTWDMCEQLKRSPICEIVPPGTSLPGQATNGNHDVTNPAAVASTGATGSGPGQRHNAGAQGEAPRGPGPDTEVGEEGQNGDLGAEEENEGVLDVASIVVSGKTNEYLARKEKEKAERAANKKAAVDAANAPRQARLPNSRRDKNIFTYEERRLTEDVNEDIHNENGKRTVDGEVQDGAESKRQKTPEPAGEGVAALTDGVTAEEGDASRRQQERAARKEEKRRHRQEQAGDRDIVRREVEVGVERLMATSGGTLEAIADAVHRTILSVEEVGKRGELWDSLVILGNGSKVRGFKDALISTLTSKYLISPSSATIFTSELPSNLSTPLATGANTPQPQPHGGVPSHLGGGGSSHVNPLLLAATTASNPTLNPASALSAANGHHGGQHNAHSSHGQTPTSIKVLKIPEYFPEWKDVGYDEAAFLGAQVAAKVVFVVDQGLSKGFMTRVEYNDLGPQGIHESCL
ncbi:MAG: Actin-like protein arp9 (SWI/SNF complex component arp9) [Pycnora praestabilis]|nr:MAG: Actin-like protein arp9 (SWI/SNF complex component arp9) [Pycnora praestabilis]